MPRFDLSGELGPDKGLRRMLDYLPLPVRNIVTAKPSELARAGVMVFTAARAA